jgi:hypothetical protein
MTDTLSIEQEDLERETPHMHESVREEAEELIRTFAAVAGDADAVYGRLREYCRGRSTDDAFGGLAAATVLIFTECITLPAEPGDPVPVSLPTD